MGFKLAPIFSDNMVLQRDSEVVVWGKAENDDLIIGKMCGQEVKAYAKNGEFRLIFKDLKAGGPFELEILSEDQEVIFNNILVGEVWIAGGQSNMEFNLKDSIGAEKEIEQSNYTEIRYYNVPDIIYENGDEVLPEGIIDTGWSVASPETAAYYSAVAYHFAKNLYNDLKVPIGIINCNKGGTSASSWMNEKYLSEDNELTEAYLEQYKKAIENLTDEEEDRLTSEFYKSQEDYNRREEEYKKKYPERSMEQLHAEIGSVPWPPPLGRKSYQRPCGIYKTKFRKITPFRVRGVIWYQGEEDSSKAHLYKKLFSRLIKCWREDLESAELPFVFVQLPMFNDEKLDTWQIVRDAQLYTYKNMKNTSMIVTSDLGEAEDVHPKDKKPVGERLALAARQDVYEENINGHSPIYLDYEIIGNKVRISFDYVLPGELIIKDDTKLNGFEIYDKNKVLHPAKAYIEKDKVIVYSEEVGEPIGVAYGWKNYIEINLFNNIGLPASPFNTLSKY
ncbi:sialate O-acetylesterase [Clostridium folliculivorans]|uniref:9-O-acetylesterase n=1 Tax=Clostridium folliculivorans TaxID=2886038 RepID=A0A9W6DCH9_9CLOT|nr:sialate O-acetylesterase [Clostridium folliculivorans]GKU27329.1 9-O-acetylesterase [Clostridium folliculivorans]GKU32180.1 9-O-acetylesterase [Clostridium folliculivorans]